MMKKRLIGACLVLFVAGVTASAGGRPDKLAARCVTATTTVISTVVSTVTETVVETTTTPTTTTNPSGEAMPAGDILGWHQQFTDDFTTDVPSGANVASSGQAGYFPQAVSDKWTAYPYPWTSYPSGTYFPERVTSIHDGEMDMYLHSETIGGVQKALVTANEPKANGPTGNLYLPTGRYVIRFKVDNVPGAHISWLLWPQTDDAGTRYWPAAGEVDYPEADSGGETAKAYQHNDGATAGTDAQAFDSGVVLSSGWHTAVTEFSAGTYDRFYLDGTLVGQTTSRVPVSPMRWVIQNASNSSSTVNVHVLVDWVAVYVPSP